MVEPGLDAGNLVARYRSEGSDGGNKARAGVCLPSRRLWHCTCAGAGGTAPLGVTRPTKGEAGGSALSQQPERGSAASTAQSPDSAASPTVVGTPG